MNRPRTRRPRESLTLIVYTWAQDSSPWYLIYLLWLLIIGLCAWYGLHQRTDDL